MRVWSIAVLSIAAFAVPATVNYGSEPKPGHQGSISPKDGKVVTPGGLPSAPSLEDLLEEPPIVALWRHAIHRRSRSDESAPPNLRIAVWSDGRVLSAKDPAKWGHELEFGRLADDALAKFKRQLSNTGVFDLKGRLSYLVPGAPVYCLVVQLDGERRLLRWDERESPGYGININPTPDDLAFIKAWKSVNKLVLAAIPDDSFQVRQRFHAVPRSWYVESGVKSE